MGRADGAGRRHPACHSLRRFAHPACHALPAAELFFLGALDCFLEGWHAADTAAGPLPMDPSRLLLARLVEAEQRARGDVRGTVMRHLRRQC